MRSVAEMEKGKRKKGRKGQGYIKGNDRGQKSLSGDDVGRFHYLLRLSTARHSVCCLDSDLGSSEALSTLAKTLHSCLNTYGKQNRLVM